MARYSGGCHCGAVRFEVEVGDGPDDHVALSCTCSICTKKGFLHIIVTAEAFTQTAGQDALTTYRFNTGVARHTFCATCGVQAFYTPRSHPCAPWIAPRTGRGSASARSTGPTGNPMSTASVRLRQ